MADVVERLPERIWVERDEETNEKRWFSVRGMGVEYVRADSQAGAGGGVDAAKALYERHRDRTRGHHGRRIMPAWDDALPETRAIYLEDIAALAPSPSAGEPTQREKEAANSAFREWWDREQECPEHSLTTQNAAHAAWQEAYRVYRATPPATPVQPTASVEAVDYRRIADEHRETITELKAEISGLRPYRDELLKIAEQVGEYNDPFAAWEVIASLTPAPTQGDGR